MCSMILQDSHVRFGSAVASLEQDGKKNLYGLSFSGRIKKKIDPLVQSQREQNIYKIEEI